VFLFKPLGAFGGRCDPFTVSAVPARLHVLLLLMMYRDGSRGGGECCACAGV
jgi:hypothetical protein